MTGAGELREQAGEERADLGVGEVAEQALAKSAASIQGGAPSRVRVRMRAAAPSRSQRLDRRATPDRRHRSA